MTDINSVGDRHTVDTGTVAMLLVGRVTFLLSVFTPPSVDGAVEAEGPGPLEPSNLFVIAGGGIT